uniref:Peptidyl-prolyl isomerase n=1 Tax=uncultured marine thaumarchaeote KM3_181_G03 TaxID=1456065 RepID=A0A075GN57_9ARCH|nr:peptidyl-prolyl isomerase [uncultured marine thaumarchaeote KM3_181_G03]
MFKILIFLILLAGSSLFVTEAFALEIELQKESDRIIESMGWLEPEQHSLKEFLQIIIEQRESKYRISVGLISTSQSDIQLPDNIEAISSNPNISSMIITNEFACAPTQIDKACVIVEVERDGLGDNLTEIKKNAREIVDKIWYDQKGEYSGAIIFVPEFYSLTIQPKGGLSGVELERLGIKGEVAKVVYTIHKQPTSQLFPALSTMLLSDNIRTSGGFYNIAEKLSGNYFSEFNVIMTPLENHMLRELHISLICSNEIRELINCERLYNELTPGDQEGKIDEQIARGYVSPLDFIQVENISRSKIFSGEFLPLNSIIQVLIYSEDDLQVKSVNSNVIENLRAIGDIQENGWFFISKAGQKIDGRYIFGQELSVSKNDLAFSIGSYSENDIEIKKVEGGNGGGCLIATAAFGSELSPQVQFLREIRDNTVLQTESGTSFMAGFNQFYYSFSPAIADYERENPTFKEAVKLTLTPLLTSLTLLHYADIDSESEMLVYGIGVILLNIGIYFVAPAVLIMTVKRRI